MAGLRVRAVLAWAMAAGAVLLAPGLARAQLDLPAAGAADGATLFKRQCATCHSLAAGDPPRQGPTLVGVYGRKAGSVEGFHYSPGFATADFVWDDPHLDAYLAQPQAVVPGAVMPYRQGKEAVRTAIIGYLKEQR